MGAYEQLDALQKELAAKYPEIGLTFGYIGNIERWGDQRCWKFFTRVCFPAQQYGASWGSYDSDDLNVMLADAKAKLERWIIDKVLPHQADRWRTFTISGHNARFLRQSIEQIGGSYGSDGQNVQRFSIRYVTLEQLRQRFPGYTIEEE